MKFTIFTSTYNRAGTIMRLYKSLTRQSFKDFEWIVINDGSTDSTDEVMQSIISKHTDFPIRYYVKKNGGKHRALNDGVRYAKGELFFIADSDDYLPDDALENVSKVEKTIPQERKIEFAGVCLLKGYDNNTIVGDSFAGEYLDITIWERKEHGITGDRSEVFYTDVLKRYPFPEFEGENFLTEVIVLDRMSLDGLKFRFYNKIVYICEYRDDGLTAKGKSIFIDNPKGWGLYISQSIDMGKFKGLYKWEHYIEYYHAEKGRLPFKEIAKNLNVSPIRLYIRFAGMKIFYRLYDKQ